MAEPPVFSSASADLPDLEPLAERLRALAHPARLAVLRRLAHEKCCVCGALVDGLPLAQSTVSQHLKVLTDAGFLRSRADGARTSYCLDAEALRALRVEIDDLFAALLPSGAGERSQES